MPLATYYRLLVAQYVSPEVHRALYLDVDMIVCRRLDAFYQTDMTNWAAAGDLLLITVHLNVWGIISLLVI